MSEAVMNASAPVLRAARCSRCRGHSFPAHVPGCRHCGAPPDALETIDCMGAVALRNVVTVHAPLAPGLAVPCVIGEVELCPGVIEEVLIDVSDEAQLALGMWLRPVWRAAEEGESGNWVFRPEDKDMKELSA